MEGGEKVWIGDAIGEFDYCERTVRKDFEDLVLGGGVGLLGLIPEGAEVGVTITVEVGVGDDRFDIL